MNKDEATPNGCTYREHKGTSTCNKLCDAGETLCPFHLLLTSKQTNDSTRKADQTPRGYREEQD
jgi:hypothetical protein